MKRVLTLCVLFLLMLAPAQALPSLKAPAAEPAAAENVSIFKPIQVKLLKWNAQINREVQKHMKALKDSPSPFVVLAAVFAAFIYGVLHTLGPGHGKMVVASYFTSHGAQFWRGVLVGVQVAFAHVAGAVFLVLTTDFAMRQILANTDQALYAMRTISFSLIFLIGLFMFWQAVRHALGKTTASTCSHCDHAHHGEHDHHAHHTGHGKQQTKREAVMAWVVGAVPCTGSLLILLYAMANDVLYLGLIMVLFVAIGMAMTMTLIGWICIFGKQNILDRFFSLSASGHKLHISLEILGSIMIMLIGAALFLAINL